jgi:hypothetical protein
MTEPNESGENPLRRISSWKAFGVFCLVVFLFFVGVVFIPWDINAPDDADLQAKPRELAPAANAFASFESAMAIRNFPAGELVVLKMILPIGYSKETWDPALADTVLAANAATFQEIEAGLACPHYVAPPFDETLDPFSDPWPESYRPLFYLLHLKSKRAQLAGDPATAVQVAFQELRFGQLVINDASGPTAWASGVDFQITALNRLNEIMADVKTPESVRRECLAQLNRWDPQALVSSYRQAMRQEYQQEVMKINGLRFGSGTSPLWYVVRVDSWLCGLARIPYCLKPNMMARMRIPFYRNLIENADRHYADINFKYPGKPKEPASAMDRAVSLVGPNGVGKKLCFLLTVPVDRLISNKCHLLADVAALRLKLALGFYEQKQGQLPDDLNALVPEYLKEIPQDPYDGQPFRYSKAEKKVWAVDCDLKDDGGKEVNPAVTRKPGRYDQVMQLGTREMKPTPPPPLGNKPKE